MAAVNETDDWRLACNSIADLWNEARLTNFRTDVIFKIGEGEKAPVFAAHKNVLAFSSPVFERMFYGPLAETGTVIIRDVETEVFEAFLSYLYGEKTGNDMRSWSVPFAAKVYLLANKYSVHHLKRTLEHKDVHIHMEVEDDREFWELVLNEQLYDIPIYAAKCIDYFSNCANDVFDSHLLYKVSASVLEEMLFTKHLKHVEEHRILGTVVTWGINNVKPGENLKDLIHNFLCNIKFSKLTADEFCTFLDIRRDFLDSKDTLDILMHLVDKTFRLPQWCNERTHCIESGSSSEENDPLEG